MKIEVLERQSIDRLCKKKYGHDNWAIIGTVTEEEMQVNEVAYIDHDEGVIFFKKAEFNYSRTLT